MKARVVIICLPSQPIRAQAPAIVFAKHPTATTVRRVQEIYVFDGDGRADVHGLPPSVPFVLERTVRARAVARFSSGVWPGGVDEQGVAGAVLGRRGRRRRRRMRRGRGRRGRRGRRRGRRRRPGRRRVRRRRGRRRRVQAFEGRVGVAVKGGRVSREAAARALARFLGKDARAARARRAARGVGVGDAAVARLGRVGSVACQQPSAAPRHARD